MAEMDIVPYIGTRTPADFDTLFDELEAARGSSASLSDAIAEKADAASNLAGYGITDAYTKAETNTALAAKQDTLTAAQLSAVNSGITAEKLTADEAALAELTAKEQQNENNILSAYGGIVGKNVAKENDFTAMLTKIVYCNPITGTIHISAASISSTDTDSTICRFILYYKDGTDSSTNYSFSRGSNISLDINIGAKIIERIVIYASDNYSHSTGDTVTVSGLMICTQADYAADPTYQPYIMSNVELTAAIQALQNGTRSAPTLAKSAEPEETEPETGEEETR